VPRGHIRGHWKLTESPISACVTEVITSKRIRRFYASSYGLVGRNAEIYLIPLFRKMTLCIYCITLTMRIGAFTFRKEFYFIYRIQHFWVSCSRKYRIEDQGRRFWLMDAKRVFDYRVPVWCRCLQHSILYNFFSVIVCVLFFFLFPVNGHAQ
jgi:hypothetical protein